VVTAFLFWPDLREFLLAIPGGLARQNDLEKSGRLYSAFTAPCQLPITKTPIIGGKEEYFVIGLDTR
jgi:hypothetical protein